MQTFPNFLIFWRVHGNAKESIVYGIIGGSGADQLKLEKIKKFMEILDVKLKNKSLYKSFMQSLNGIDQKYKQNWKFYPRVFEGGGGADPTRASEFCDSPEICILPR